MIEHWIYWILGKDIANTLGTAGTEFVILILPFVIGWFLGRKASGY